MSRDCCHPNRLARILQLVPVVLAVLAGMCAVASTLSRRLRLVMTYAVFVLDVLATVCLLVVIAKMPDLVGSTRDITQTLGGGVQYGDLVSNHHDWGFWLSPALVVVGSGCAALQVVSVRSRDRR